MNNMFDDEHYGEVNDALPTPQSAGAVIQGGSTLRQMKTAYITAVAVQKERNLADVERRCLMEARLAGESCYYGWSVKGKGGKSEVIEGPSIEGAMIIARNFGNCAVELGPTEETEKSFVFTAYFLDLETGVTLPRQFRISKDYIIYGKMDVERKMDIRFQIAQSKCIRNAIIRAVPSWLVAKVMDTAKQGVRERIQKAIDKKGLPEVRKLALAALEKQGVNLERVELRFDKKYGAWDLETIVSIQGDIKALQDGIEDADSLYPQEKKGEATGELDLADMTKGDPATHQGYDDKKEEEK